MSSNELNNVAKSIKEIPFNDTWKGEVCEKQEENIKNIVERIENLQNKIIEFESYVEKIDEYRALKQRIQELENRISQLKSEQKYVNIYDHKGNKIGEKLEPDNSLLIEEAENEKSILEEEKERLHQELINYFSNTSVGDGSSISISAVTCDLTEESDAAEPEEKNNKLNDLNKNSNSKESNPKNKNNYESLSNSLADDLHEKVSSDIDKDNNYTPNNNYPTNTEHSNSGGSYHPNSNNGYNQLPTPGYVDSNRNNEIGINNKKLIIEKDLSIIEQLFPNIDLKDFDIKSETEKFKIIESGINYILQNNTAKVEFLTLITNIENHYVDDLDSNTKSKINYYITLKQIIKKLANKSDNSI